MIEFSSAILAEIMSETLLFVAEDHIDGTVLDQNLQWICLPFLAKPYECSIMFDVESERCAVEYATAIQSSSVAMSALATLVYLSNEGAHIIIVCYDFDVEKSHLPLLLDVIENLFVKDAPELRLVG